MLDTELSGRILCLGNDIAGDDGVGLAIGRELQTMPLPAGVSVELAARLDLDLLSTLSSEQRALLVDAMPGPEPGRCQLRELTLSSGAPPSALHAMDLASLFTLARRLIPDRLPARLDLLTVEVAPLDRYSEELSEEVKAAVPEAVKMALAWI